MGVISVVTTIIYVAIFIFFLLMWARFIFDLATSFVRGFTPKGPLLVLAEITYTATDPPIRAVRKLVPSLRIGGVALDFGWSIVMLAVIILMNIVSVGFTI